MGKDAPFMVFSSHTAGERKGVTKKKRVRHYMENARAGFLNDN